MIFTPDLAKAPKIIQWRSSWKLTLKASSNVAFQDKGNFLGLVQFQEILLFDFLYLMAAGPQARIREHSAHLSQD